MATQPTPSAKTRLSDALREFLLLEEALRSVRARSSDQQAMVRQLIGAADGRLSVVDALGSDQHLPAALVLLRDAAVLIIQAVLEVHGAQGDEITPSGAFERVAALVERGELPRPPPEFDRVQQLFSDTRPLAFDELAPSAALARRSEAERTIAWLRRQVDPRSVPQIRAIRASRVGLLGLGILGSLVWATVHLFAPKSIALGKPVQLSSRRPYCPAGAGPAGLSASGLVDGSKSSTYEICTKPERRPWLTVDLLAAYPLSKVVVYNRGDCCWGQNDLPAVLEVSPDGVAFTEVGRRVTAYSSADPWVIGLHGEKARIVRLRVDSDDPYRELVLNELEVFVR
jgi:F5/8 type C domain